MSTALLSPSPAVEAATRREFIALLGAAGLLSACSAGPDPAGTQAPTRQVTDQLGRFVDIPVAPQRVVVLDPNRVVSEVVALGLVPVGATTNAVNPDAGFSPFLGPTAQQITSVGVVGQAAPEKIVALSPDLILFASAYQEDLDLDTLSAIAPVFGYEAASGLLEPSRWLGDVLGRAGDAARVETAFDDLITRRRAELGLDGVRVAVVNLGNYETSPSVQVLSPNQGVNQVLALLGAVYAPARYADQDGVDVSMELVGTELADTDTLVALRYGGGPDNEARFSAITTAPVWQAVPAVAAGRVAYLDIQEANANYGLAGVEAALDDLAAQLGRPES